MEQEEIHVWDFPENIYVKLPEEYRNVFFQLAFLEFKKTSNLQMILKKNKLPTNIIRWREGRDKGHKQLTHLKSLLYLIPYVKIRRENITKVYNKIIINNFKEKRIDKDKDIIYLIKELMYILKGNKNLSKLTNINEGTLRSYARYNKIKTLPAFFVKDLVKIIEDRIIKFSFSLKELENKIISYKASHGKEINPEFNNERKLPIKVDPEFESIIYHLMADGYVSKIGSSEYTQLSEIGKKNFLDKLFRVFGKFDFSEEGLKNGRVYISKTIISIICNYYHLAPNDFKWNSSMLPDICKTRDNSFKLAGLLSFIVDEGYIGTNKITVHSSNKILLSQIRQLGLDLDISCYEIKLKKGRNNTKDSFRFNIPKRSIKELFDKTKELEEKYTTCNLAQKESKVLSIINQ